nr:mycofactocin biosynthesis glycosyltransferase MftF [Janibacter melonis]
MTPAPHPTGPTTATHQVAAPLPHGFHIRLRPDVIQLEDGHLLVGGSPLRAVRLQGVMATLLRNQDLRVEGADSARLARRLIDANLADPVIMGSIAPDEITVIIPVHQRLTQLERALTALSGANVIVVDDASPEPTALRSVVRRHDATLIVLPQNRGPAAARNAGLAHVNTRYVAFVDSDVEVTAEQLFCLGAHMADPLVALVGPQVRGTTRSPNPSWVEQYDADASSLTLGTRACSVQPGAAVAWLPSACLVGRTEVLQHPEIAGFHSDLRVAEDVDLVWRLVQHGYRVRYEPAIHALHDARTTLGDWLERKYYYGTGSALLGARYGDYIAPAVLSPVMAVAAAAVLAQGRLAIPAVPMAITWAARTIRPALGTSPGATRTAAHLAVRGLGWSLRQEAALLLRHWWPAAAVGCVFSRTARRMVLSGLVVDLMGWILDGQPGGINFPRWFARRLDDMAYGAGVWVGACRQHSSQALRVRVLRKKR